MFNYLISLFYVYLKRAIQIMYSLPIFVSELNVYKHTQQNISVTEMCGTVTLQTRLYCCIARRKFQCLLSYKITIQRLKHIIFSKPLKRYTFLRLQQIVTILQFNPVTMSTALGLHMTYHVGFGKQAVLSEWYGKRIAVTNRCIFSLKMFLFPKPVREYRDATKSSAQ